MYRASNPQSTRDIAENNFPELMKRIVDNKDFAPHRIESKWLVTNKRLKSKCNGSSPACLKEISADTQESKRRNGVMAVWSMFQSRSISIQKMIRRGLQELGLTYEMTSGRVRKKRRGWKTAIDQQAQLELDFMTLLAEFTAGDPMRDGVLWTNLSLCEIGRRLRDLGTPISRHRVRKLLKKYGLNKRKARKKKSMGVHPDRNAQFENIARLKTEYLAAGDPVISIDTKKKELVGDFAREGHTHTQVPVDTLDHDFPSAGQGKLIPHGIYDLARNEGAVHLNTAMIPVNSVATALRLLVLCDGGGSNVSNRHVFKEALQDLAELLGVEIRIAHYPPYCSKHNPIEHRLFPHITRAC